MNRIQRPFRTTMTIITPLASQELLCFSIKGWDRNYYPHFTGKNQSVPKVAKLVLAAVLPRAQACLFPKPPAHPVLVRTGSLAWACRRVGALRVRDLASETKLSHLILTFPLLLPLEKGSIWVQAKKGLLSHENNAHIEWAKPGTPKGNFSLHLEMEK